MNRWAIYDATGRIDRIYSGPEFEAFLQPASDEGVVLIATDLDDANAFIQQGVVQPQPKQPFPFTISQTEITADGVDECLITGIPAGTTVEWPDGQVDEVTDGEVAFAVDLPGTYTLTFDAVPYLRQEVTIEAVAAT